MAADGGFLEEHGRPGAFGALMDEYDPEMLLEHAVVHLLRHRRQLERWPRPPPERETEATVPRGLSGALPRVHRGRPAARGRSGGPAAAPGGIPNLRPSTVWKWKAAFAAGASGDPSPDGGAGSPRFSQFVDPGRKGDGCGIP